MRLRRLALSAAAAALAAAIANDCARGNGGDGAPPRGRVRVVAVHPHDSAAFTQGLLWHRGRLYESLGGYGSSRLREVEPATGRVVREVALPAGEFGEGLALVGERLIQLTWHEGIARVWRLEDFALLATWRYTGEGWGLTFDGRELVQSDGGATLTFRSADDFSPRRTLRVRRGGRPEAYLNELEWADGALYANVWQSDEIVRIDPASGEVVAVFDAGGLLPAAVRAETDVLNGIAYEPERRRFFVTGKLWPQLFEVELVEPSR
jgi:glutamine cyclotransferase